MNWERIIAATDGRPQSLARIVDQDDADGAALATLLLLEETPPPTAALIAAAKMVRRHGALPTHAALAPQIAAALADWRADPQVLGAAFGSAKQERLTWSVAQMVGALRDRPAALRGAVAIVRRSGDQWCVARCLDALGADGWRALEEDQRAALLKDAPADALGPVWGALDKAQRAATTQRTEGRSGDAARLIGSIGAAAWRATDRALRKRLIDAAVRDRYGIPETAPAWPSMTDDERAVLATAVIEHGDSWTAFHVLKNLGAAGRAPLAADLRAALERRAMGEPDAWRVLAWRAADAGWGALTDEERDALMTAAGQEPWRVPVLLRIVGVAGWRAMDDRERERLAVVVRHAPDDLFACPPALWSALAGAALPPATEISWDAPEFWRAEDVDADLVALPPAHRALVLALAPWRPEDAAKDSVRVQRLLAAWRALTDAARATLATAAPGVLPPVAAAARLHGGVSAAVDVVGATVARIATATGGAAAKRAVAAMLRTPDRWRSWMIAFAPTDDDPPDAWAAWRRAARRGVVPDSALCARLAAKERAAGATRRGLRRARR